MIWWLAMNGGIANFLKFDILNCDFFELYEDNCKNDGSSWSLMKFFPTCYC
jgi:hypothetical protein